ncbi:hypothetical protein RJ640_018241 [Escallonia rubra]|uniref:Uncharacterized protein n=1 Tax=Escallonia rubra TaxID=112253 RepID=A0AA88QEL5_9ASTE|nr:hypothetical protein RJ640_018241 [Escallonia rubra]
MEVNIHGNQEYMLDKQEVLETLTTVMARPYQGTAQFEKDQEVYEQWLKNDRVLEAYGSQRDPNDNIRTFEDIARHLELKDERLRAATASDAYIQMSERWWEWNGVRPEQKKGKNNKGKRGKRGKKDKSKMTCYNYNKKRHFTVSALQQKRYSETFSDCFVTSCVLVAESLPVCIVDFEAIDHIIRERIEFAKYCHIPSGSKRVYMGNLSSVEGNKVDIFQKTIFYGFGYLSNGFMVLDIVNNPHYDSSFSLLASVDHAPNDSIKWNARLSHIGQDRMARHWMCNYCDKKVVGSYLKVTGHMLAIPLCGVTACKNLSVKIMKAIKKEHDDAKRRKNILILEARK